jgi:5'-3' exonuclease
MCLQNWGEPSISPGHLSALLSNRLFSSTQGYLTDSGDVALERVEMIMTDLGYVEDEIFKNRQQSEIRFKANLKRRKMMEQRQQRPNFNQMHKNPQFAPVVRSKCRCFSFKRCKFL